MRYRRDFFTVHLAERSRVLRVDTIERLRNLVRAVRQKHPFDILAWVVLPDRLHALGELPEGDGSSRVFRGVRGDLLPKWSTR